MTTYIGGTSLLADGIVYAIGATHLYVIDATGLVRTFDTKATITSLMAIAKDGTALFCAGDTLYAR